ncbi:hypothetical protein DBT40_06735 [Aerococcus tenax]|nr:hypothetical protein DBT40_06735 [Aerococcus urinae]RAW04742.1 hypothetical protein DBT41_06745 [Aerococcus urinae]
MRKDQGGRFLGGKDEKISMADRSTFLKGHPLTLPNSTSDATVTTKDEITGGNCQKHSGTVRWQFLKWTFVL